MGLKREGVRGQARKASGGRPLPSLPMPDPGAASFSLSLCPLLIPLANLSQVPLLFKHCMVLWQDREIKMVPTPAENKVSQTNTAGVA
jgi:hypothetical protein